jgi:predicted ATPase
MMGCPAVRLFEQRAAAASPGFSVDERSAPVAAAICSRLDGLPLAIELAAARTRSLSLRALLERLDHRLVLLSDGPRDLPTRQRTLRSEIDWSHDLLDDEEKQLFRRLAVFAGGCTAESAAAVCLDRGEDAFPSVLVRLSTLKDKSLVEVRDSVEGPRFYMLQTIREYALERLEACDETEILHQRLVTWCCGLAEMAEPLLYGPDQRRWFDRLETEHANIRSSLEWLLGRRDGEQGLRLSGAMGWFWFRRARFIEGQRWLEAFAGFGDAGSRAAEPGSGTISGG